MDAKATLLVFQEGEEAEKICSTLQPIEIWLGFSVKFRCDIATPKQVLMEINYDEWGKRKSY